MNQKQREKLWGYQINIPPSTPVTSLTGKQLVFLFEMDLNQAIKIAKNIDNLQLGELLLRRCVTCNMVIGVHKKPAWIKEVFPHRCEMCASVLIANGVNEYEAYYD